MSTFGTLTCHTVNQDHVNVVFESHFTGKTVKKKIYNLLRKCSFWAEKQYDCVFIFLFDLILLLGVKIFKLYMCLNFPKVTGKTLKLYLLYVLADKWKIRLLL